MVPPGFPVPLVLTHNAEGGPGSLESDGVSALWGTADQSEMSDGRELGREIPHPSSSESLFQDTHLASLSRDTPSAQWDEPA